MTTDSEFEGDLVDSYLEYLRGRGSKPSITHLSDFDQERYRALFQMLDAITDSEVVKSPPFEDDPLAIRLGLTPESSHPEAALADVELTGVPQSIADSLADVAHSFGLDVLIQSAAESPELLSQTNGLRPWAECQTLGERIVVCSTDYDLNSHELFSNTARILDAVNTVTAVVVVSLETNEGVLLTRDRSVRSIDPINGWVDPEVTYAPQPLELALGSHLHASLPRWDRIATLEELLVLIDVEDDIRVSVEASLRTFVGRRANIPAKREALTQLRSLATDPFVEILHDVQKNALSSEELIVRLRSLSERSPS